MDAPDGSFILKVDSTSLQVHREGQEPIIWGFDTFADRVDIAGVHWATPAQAERWRAQGALSPVAETVPPEHESALDAALEDLVFPSDLGSSGEWATTAVGHTTRLTFTPSPHGPFGTVDVQRDDREATVHRLDRSLSPGVAMVDYLPDPTTAQREAFVKGESVDVPIRTAVFGAVGLPDGRMIATLSSGPIGVRDTTGDRWVRMGKRGPVVGVRTDAGCSEREVDGDVPRTVACRAVGDRVFLGGPTSSQSYHAQGAVLASDAALVFRRTDAAVP